MKWPLRCAALSEFCHVVCPWRRVIRLDALKSLTSSKSSSSQPGGPGQDATGPFDFSGTLLRADQRGARMPDSGGGPQISPDTMSALLAAQSQSTDAGSSAPTSRADALKDLFSRIDADGDGKISKSEFENALGAGGTNLAQADDVFGKLDKNGDGSVSLDEMASALKGQAAITIITRCFRRQLRLRRIEFRSLAAGARAALPAPHVTNSDGSTTTSLTYADGSKVTMTSAAAASASGLRLRPTISSSR